MKRFVVLTFLLTLVANAYAVNALATLCMDESDVAIAVTDSGSNSSSPCHGQDRAVPIVAELSADHCESACFCLHSCMQQAKLLVGLSSIFAAESGTSSISSLPNEPSSISILPPRRPPKSLS